MSILSRSFVVLKHEREIAEVPEFNLRLIHLESAFQSIILVSLWLLKYIHNAVLDAFPGLGHRLLQNPDTLSHEWEETRFHDFLHLHLYLLPVLGREYLSSDLPGGGLRHCHLHVDEVSRIQIDIMVHPEVLKLVLVLRVALRCILHAHGHFEDQVTLELLLQRVVHVCVG